jgi:hypothetical protein
MNAEFVAVGSTTIAAMHPDNSTRQDQAGNHFSHSATCAEALDPASLHCSKERKYYDSHTGICLAASFYKVMIERSSDMRNLLKRCGDRELLWALMAVFGAIVIAINS